MTTRNPFDRLASLGEEVLGKAADHPKAGRFVQSAMQMKDRVDDLSKRVRGLEQMEKRIAQLEKRLAKVEGPAKTPARLITFLNQQIVKHMNQTEVKERLAAGGSEVTPAVVLTGANYIPTHA